jgi:hypothetical protein
MNRHEGMEANMPEISSGPAYTSQWERLPETLQRLMAAGLSEESAKSGLCAAIADRAVEIRLKPDRHTTTGMKHSTVLFTGEDIQVPSDLSPADLDFQSSRPLKPWLIPREKHPELKGWWHIKQIEVWGPDVTAAFLAIPVKTLPLAPDAPKPPRRPKTPTGRERADKVIEELFPDRVLVRDQSRLPNSNLFKAVAARIKELGLPEVSNDTILRAAGRRK